jgi:hypothetical protein
MLTVIVEREEVQIAKNKKEVHTLLTIWDFDNSGSFKSVRQRRIKAHPIDVYELLSLMKNNGLQVFEIVCDVF